MRRSLMKQARREAFKEGDWFPLGKPKTPFEKRWFDLRRAVVLWRRVQARQAQLKSLHRRPVRATVAIDHGSWIVGLSTLTDAELILAHDEGERMKRDGVHSSPHVALVPQLVLSVVRVKDDAPGRVDLWSVDSLERVLALDDQDVRTAENAHVAGERIWAPPLRPIDILLGLSSKSIETLVKAYNDMNSEHLFGTHRKHYIMFCIESSDIPDEVKLKIDTLPDEAYGKK
jgi:hypothetical protein